MDLAIPVISIVAIYCLSVLVLTYGFASLPDDRGVKANHFHFISVIVALRNEEHNLPALIDQFNVLDYPVDKFEIIFVDDHSTDGSPQILQAHCDGRHLKWITLTSGSGKKAAITVAVAQSVADIIVTTDADCLVNTNWLRYINAMFTDGNIKMAVGGVRISANNTLFHKLQSLEFVSVAATGAATLSLASPTMCNGANLSFLRSAFDGAGGYSGSQNVSSGDDEYLMNEFHRRWKGSIAFMNSDMSVVSTSASSTLKGFFQQRLRWAGKWKANRSFSTKAIAFGAWLLQLLLLTIPFLWIAGMLDTRVFLMLVGAKLFVDFIFLFQAARFFSVPWSWISFLVLQFVYPLYVIAVGLLSQILTPQWKGRAVETKV